MKKRNFILRADFIDKKGLSLFFKADVFKNTVLFFLIIIFFPILIRIFPHYSGRSYILSKENRMKVEKPEFNFRSVFPYFKKYENFYNDNFVFRNFLINEYNRLKFFLFKISPVDSVIIGKEGWLFLGKESGVNLLRYYLAYDYRTNSMLNEWKNRIKERKKWAESLGCDYVYVIVPDKQTVYSEMMPDGADKFPKLSILDQIVKFLKIEGVDFLIDLREDFKNVVKRRVLYQKTDTHWNQLGAYIAYKRIVKSLKISSGLSVLPERINKFKIFRHINTEGDLSRMLLLGDKIFSNNMIKLVRRKSRGIKREKIYLPSTKSEISVDENREGLLAPVLMIHDSFGEYLKLFLPVHFKMSFYSTNRNLKLYRELILKRGVKYIIEVIAERYFIQRPPNSIK